MVREVVPRSGELQAACWRYAGYGRGAKELRHSVPDFMEIVVHTQKADINARII